MKVENVVKLGEREREREEEERKDEWVSNTGQPDRCAYCVKERNIIRSRRLAPQLSPLLKTQASTPHMPSLQHRSRRDDNFLEIPIFHFGLMPIYYLSCTKCLRGPHILFRSWWDHAFSHSKTWQWSKAAFPVVQHTERAGWKPEARLAERKLVGHMHFV